MNENHYDLLVIGSGSAARAGGNKAMHDFGARVALVEHERWGGSCPNVACRPTKAYVVAAELLHDVAHHAAERGIDLPPPTIDLAQTRRWKDSLRRDQESWIETLRDAGFALHPGAATFVDKRTVRLGEQELTADNVLVATGGRTALPAIRGIDDVDWLDHVSALELDAIPESLLIVGGGPVGLEFAQIFARFGSRITLVNTSPQIAMRSDTEAAAELQQALEDEGIEIVLNASVAALERTHAGVEATIGGRTLTVSAVLLASGRVPNLEALDITRLPLEVGRGGLIVDDRQRTSVDGIWAAGDVASGPMLTPVAQYQARIAVEDMFGAGGKRADYSVLPSAIFTDPELADIGLTERQAVEQGYDVEVVKHPLPALTRAQYISAKHGIYKIVFDRTTRRVLGVHVVSRGASDIVGALTPALNLGLTVDDLAFMHHIYPSYSEGLKAAAERALAPVTA
jgi:mercuric reductase